MRFESLLSDVGSKAKVYFFHVLVVSAEVGNANHHQSDHTKMIS